LDYMPLQGKELFSKISETLTGEERGGKVGATQKKVRNKSGFSGESRFAFLGGKGRVVELSIQRYAITLWTNGEGGKILGQGIETGGTSLALRVVLSLL